MSFAHIPNLESQNIYIPLVVGQTRYDINEVRKIMPDRNEQIRVVGLETFIETQLAVTPDGLAVATENQVKDCYLTLVNGQTEVISQMPLQDLRAANYNGNRFECNYSNVDFTRSYVEFGRDTNITAKVIVITVFFERVPLS